MLDTFQALPARLKAYPRNGNFWLDYTIGKRVCDFLAAIVERAPGQVVQPHILPDLEYVLAGLVAEGIAQAAALEISIRGITQPD